MTKSQQNTLKQLHKLSVSQLAELSNLSRAYISQVKHGKRSPSPKLLDALASLERPKKPDKRSVPAIPPGKGSKPTNVTILSRKAIKIHCLC